MNKIIFIYFIINFISSNLGNAIKGYDENGNVLYSNDIINNDDQYYPTEDIINDFEEIGSSNEKISSNNDEIINNNEIISNNKIFNNNEIINNDEIFNNNEISNNNEIIKNNEIINNNDNLPYYNTEEIIANNNFEETTFNNNELNNNNYYLEEMVNNKLNNGNFDEEIANNYNSLEGNVNVYNDNSYEGIVYNNNNFDEEIENNNNNFYEETVNNNSVEEITNNNEFINNNNSGEEITNNNEYNNKNGININELDMEDSVTNNLFDMTDHYYEYSQEGAPCDNLNENSNCPFRFITLGPVLYNEYECYIHSPKAGPNDSFEYLGRIPQKMNVDINAQLKCIINGKEYRTMGRVNIRGSGRCDNEDKYKYRVIPSKTSLRHGKNNVDFGGYILTITIDRCESVWSQKNIQYQNTCKINWAGLSSTTCGMVNGVGLICMNNGCCSKNGQCGTSSAHCGEGCQSYYGKCNSKNTSSSSSSINQNSLYSYSLSLSPSPSSSISTDGKCGSKNNNKSCPSGYCCSKYGYCGKTSDYCSIKKGCQKPFGICE